MDPDPQDSALRPRRPNHLAFVRDSDLTVYSERTGSTPDNSSSSSVCEADSCRNTLTINDLEVSLDSECSPATEQHVVSCRAETVPDSAMQSPAPHIVRILSMDHLDLSMVASKARNRSTASSVTHIQPIRPRRPHDHPSSSRSPAPTLDLPRETAPPKLLPRTTQCSITSSLLDDDGYLISRPHACSPKPHPNPDLNIPPRLPKREPAAIPPPRPSPRVPSPPSLVNFTIESRPPSPSGSAELTTTNHRSAASSRIPNSDQANNTRSRRRKRRPHHLLRRRSLILISMASLLLSILSALLLVMVLLNPFRVEWRRRTFRENSYKTCVKCLSLMDEQDLMTWTISPEMKLLDNKIERDGNVYCCASTSQQMTALVKLIAKQLNYKPSPEHLAGAATSVVPSAQIGFADSNNNKLDVIMDEKPYMRIQPHLATSVQHIQKVYGNNVYLKVEFSGQYYVYSNVYYAHCSPAKHNIIEHDIRLVSPSNPVQAGRLIKSAYTCCNDCSTQDRHSSFNGAVFTLNQGDHIISTVSNTSVIQYDQFSYVGLVLLGG